MQRSLIGETALVTGASRGIGKAIAEALVGAGARVAGVGRNAATIESAMHGLGEPEQTLALVADLTHPAEARACLRVVEEAWDFPSIVVHAAGSGGFASVDQLTDEAWEACRAINLDAVVTLATAVLPRLAQRGRGHLVVINSIAAVHTFPGASAYCATKAGARAFLATAREEVRRSGVRVTTVIAGSVDTPFWDAYDLGLDRQQMLHPEDIADAVLAALQASPRAAVDEIQILPRAGIL
ncbi:MAG TPA: SDR family NAD(P)-dependent oxidoreductase [Chloroflexota bacterium]|nr:SDR family NAD(P)-dependent oxidoreductase [Chloroflexota bacterium]